MRPMMKFANQPYGFWEACAAALLAAFWWCFGGLGLTLGVVLLFTVADFATGVMRAAIRGEVESRKYMRTVHKLVGYSLLLGLMHVFFVRYLPTVPGVEALTATLTTLPHLVGAFIALREFSSNVENLARAGILPPGVTRALARVFIQVRKEIQSQGLEEIGPDDTG